jgi:hypothetical protein
MIIPLVKRHTTTGGVLRQFLSMYVTADDFDTASNPEFLLFDPK